MSTVVEWRDGRPICPRCRAKGYYHWLMVWCVMCGWARYWRQS